MKNWNIPRSDAIDIVVNLKRTWRWGNLSIASAAENVARKHYAGKSYRHAARLLAKDALALFWERHAGRTVNQETHIKEITRMTNTLESEGAARTIE